MSYTVKHKYFEKHGVVSVVTTGERATVRYSLSGNLPIRYPGKLQISKLAQYKKYIFVEDPPGPEGQPVHPGRWHEQLVTLPLTIEIKTPDGKPFTADSVTLNDLKRFRDLRGTSQGSWSFTIHGESEPILIIPGETRVTADNVHIHIWLEETVKSKSAPPLVSKTLTSPAEQRYVFDLYRVGTFIATLKIGSSALHRKMELIDPDGVVVKTSPIGRLNFTVSLRTLNKSRDANGNVRLWTLHIPAVAHAGDNPVTLWASVVQTSTIQTNTLQDRINTLIGINGSKLSIYGEMKDSYILGRLKISDEISAETIDMHGLLDSVITSVPQDGNATTDIEHDVVYTLARFSQNFKYGFHASLKNNFRINSINITIGASEKIQPVIPVLKIIVKVQGYVAVDFHGIELATGKIKNDVIHLEAGIRLNTNGTFSAATWIDEDLLDIDVNWSAALVAALLTAGLGGVGAIVAGEIVEDYLNKAIIDKFKSTAEGVMTQVPEILAMILGDDFTYQSLRLNGNDIVFEYIAPLEAEPKPNKNYRGVIGRTIFESPIVGNPFRIMPRSLGDTWKGDNLAKIDHIVYVMMENRSFDHVLGYLAQRQGHETSNGLSNELIEYLKAEGYNLGKLNQSGIIENALRLKTKFPASVGHGLKDVSVQLGDEPLTFAGKSINNPSGFLTNFEERALEHPEITKEDVLGYYVASDLQFYKFLVDNYSYCENFFCSHPGPTLPNRMFSLTGDLQYDRVGEIIQNNNSHDNFSLSRSMSIYDLLTRKNVKWRVYESYPSVTMLRMFARYATDNTNIVSIDRLQHDVDQGNLPPVTIIEPAMHHFPENDDHSPDADMYNGQLFLKGIYDTLRSNNALWSKTMLIITYDEHGGFYDHVIPPVADLRIVKNTTPPIAVLQTVSNSITQNQAGNPDNPALVGGAVSKSLKTSYGVRVPTFIVSPWTIAGKGPDTVLDFCSILKTIIVRFCGQDKPFISDRVSDSYSLDGYLNATAARMNVPNSPSMPPLTMNQVQNTQKIKTKPISRKQMRSGNIDYHDMSGMLGRMLGR